MRLINEDDVLEIIERVTNEAVEKKQPKYLIQKRIIAEISGLPTIETVDWINVKEDVPSYDEEVLVYTENGYTVGFYTAGCYDGEWNLDIDLGTVTHWQHLPKPPKGE